MASLAPIVLFVYNRPEHTRKTLEALKACAEAKDSELFVFADGPKPGADTAPVEAVRHLCLEISGFTSVTTVFREENLGLAASVKAGIDQVLETHSTVIVLEDDIVVSPGFLNYMNGALDTFSSEKTVHAVSGYSFFSSRWMPKQYALRVMSSWGWGTWKDRWTSLDWDAAQLQVQVNQTSKKKFDFAGFSYLKLLRLQVEGAINSWAILFYANMYLQSKVCMFPGYSLVDNVGFDGTGTHTSTSELWKEPIANSLNNNLDLCLSREQALLRYIVEWHVIKKRKRV